MFFGTAALGSVSEERSCEIVPVSPRFETARPAPSASTASTISAPSAAPTVRRVAGLGAPRSPKKPIAMPASVSTTSIAASSTPS